MMDILYGLLPAILVFGLIMVGVLIWAVKSGQYDDMEGPAHRIIMDDDDPKIPVDQPGKKDNKKKSQ